MRTCLITAFYRQHKEWEYFVQSLKEQTVFPDEIVIGIDDLKDRVPDLKGLPFSVVRSYGKPKDRTGRGIVLNKALEITDAEVVITTDSDCILNPKFVETYKRIYEGRLKQWDYTVHYEGGKRPSIDTHRVRGDVTTQIFVGPRFFIPKLSKLPKEYDWQTFNSLSTHDHHGCRGRENHTAKIMGCNLAFFRRAFKFSKFSHGRGQDQYFWKKLQENKPGVYSLRAAPDFNYVLHIGPNNVGQYW